MKQKRTWIQVHALLAGVTAALLLVMPAIAVGKPIGNHFPDEMVEEQRRAVAAKAEQIRLVTEELCEIDPAEWTSEQTFRYLHTALWTVYNGLNLYFQINGELPADLAGLAGTEFVPAWPGNPFNQWEPVRVLLASSGFSPGDVTLQLCPPEFFSYPASPRPISCETGIYGPSLEFAYAANPHPAKANTWAVVPEGTIFMLGQHAEPASVTAEKFRQLREQLQQIEQEEAQE